MRPDIPFVRSRLPRTGRGARGSVTAEAAMVLPVLVLVTLALVWLSGLVLTQVRLVDSARETARAIARDDPVEAAWAQGRRVAPEGARFELDTRDGLVAVTVRAQPSVPRFLQFLPRPTLAAEAVTAVEASGGPG